MIRVCSIYSPNLSLKQILVSVKLEGFNEFVKLINVYTHSDRKDQEKFMKGIWKFQFNETNLGSALLVKICVHQIFDVWNFIVTIKACVYYFYFCYENKTFKKLSKMLFVLPKNSFWPQDFIKFLYFTLSLFCPFLAIAGFIEVDWW